jgi:hypothetical protein
MTGSLGRAVGERRLQMKRGGCCVLMGKARLQKTIDSGRAVGKRRLQTTRGGRRRLQKARGEGRVLVRKKARTCCRVVGKGRL